MNVHEYQAKALFKKYQLPVSNGYVATSAQQAYESAQKIGWPCVVKAQVHAGGRGKAGGVKLVSSRKDVFAFCKQHLGKNLVTFQTGADGQPVKTILVESVTEIERELYLGAVVDRATRRVVFMASSEGGVDIEHVASKTPHKIFRITLNPLTGILPYQGRELAFKLRLTGSQVTAFCDVLMKLSRLFVEKDLSLLEINPLVVTKAGKIHCLDAKINIDDNALYRHPDLIKLHDPTQEDKRENDARNWQLNYVALDGNIGCMVNGAGLAMGTMDVIQLHGGSPANFLDVGGTATSERVSEAFRIILSDGNVRAVLINIFGGIVRCDLIAEGILQAIKQVKITIPVIVRLEGNNSDIGLKLLKESNLSIETESSLTKAAKRAVAHAKKGKKS